MKTTWMGIVAALLCACTTPQEGGRRGLYSYPDAGQVPTDGGTLCGHVVCDVNATCGTVGKTETCTCKAGFEGDGTVCTDIDECARGTSNCDVNADCTNRSPGFSCACKKGFSGQDGKSCTDVDECAAGTDTCDPNADCTNTPGAYECTCHDGFQGDGSVCSTGPGCKTACLSNEHCVDAPAGFVCSCSPGFARGANGACIALCDDTNGPVCPTHGVCRVDGRTAVCDACAPGFSGSGTTCTAASCQPECDGAGSDDAPHAICKADGTCACGPGYSGASGSCTDVNECATNGGGCGDNTDCINVDGGHLCDCKAGYTVDGSGKCVDVDECKQSPSPCHPDATCTNKTPAEEPQGFVCTCKSGFTGDGFGCTDIDECKTNNGGCPSGSDCVNTRGSSTCSCPAGLVGEPGNCHCDLTGIWAMRQDVDTCWGSVPVMAGSSQNLIAPGYMEATVWELHEIQYDGTRVNVRKRGCGTDNYPDLISPIFGETYSASVPFATFDALGLVQGAPFDAPALVPGSSYVAPSEAAVIGIDLGSDPVHAPWPTSFDQVNASSWVDADNDGEPGLTLWPGLPSQLTDKGKLGSGSKYSYIPARPTISGGSLVIDERAACVSVALRVITHVEARIDTCTHIVGDVINEKTEGRVHSCVLAKKGTPCDTGQPMSPSNCPGWGTDQTCGRADWSAAATAARCNDQDLGRLDNNQNQKQNSTATFELRKIGNVGDAVTCADVRTACFPTASDSDCGAIVHLAPNITCTTPP